MYIPCIIFETEYFDLGGPLLSAAWTKSKKEALINYISTGKCLHNIYAGRYVLCEILNFANVVSLLSFVFINSRYLRN